MLKGRSDSPMWKRGNLSRSSTITLRPAFASKIAAVLPAGPPPMIATSYFSTGQKVVEFVRKQSSVALRIVAAGRFSAADISRHGPRSLRHELSRCDKKVARMRDQENPCFDGNARLTS